MLLLLMFPILTSGIVVWVIHRAASRTMLRNVLLWVPTLALLGFCMVSDLSIGVFYLPAAMALFVVIILDSFAPS